MRRQSLFCVFTVLLVALSSAAEPSKPFGIERRTLWTTSRVVGTPEPPPPYTVARAFNKLKFDHPLFLVAEPNTDRMLVIEMAGKIFAFPDRKDADRSDLFLEVPNHDLYSIAFHPRYAENGYVYVFANGPKGSKPKKDRFFRYTAGRAGARVCDPASQRLMIEWDSPGHNGGDLAFGPDGYLYIGAGDGSNGSDLKLTGQDLSDFDSSVLRIDVDRAESGKPYSIPKDNPFVNTPKARPEIWAYGFRQPWRMSFDPKSGRLWMGDVGQDTWELIHLVERGGNYGWSIFEGSHPFQLNRPRGPTPIRKPIVEHHHSEARSIIGGHVYHGARLKELQGKYIYGDYATGRIWGLDYADGKLIANPVLADTSLQMAGFGLDHAGELYIVDHIGPIYRLERAIPEPRRADFPRRLSETGLFASVKDHVPQAGLIPYSVNSPLWSDGAFKERFIALPGASQITFNDEIGWDFPEGGVLVKTFSLECSRTRQSSGNSGAPARSLTTSATEPDRLPTTTRRRIETRLLVFQKGQWRGYSYMWNDAQTDAELVAAAGVDRAYSVSDPSKPTGTREQSWHYPSRAECMVCHSRAAGFVLGLNTLQMNRVHNYGKVADNQLRTLEHLGVLRVPPPKETPNATATNKLAKRPEQFARLPDPFDRNIDLHLRARSYLHANCAQCHVQDGGGNSAIDLHFNTPADKTRAIGQRPLHDSFGIRDAQIIAPGAPARSTLYYRLTTHSRGRMPPLATSIVDVQAAGLIAEWIKAMPAK